MMREGKTKTLLVVVLVLFGIIVDGFHKNKQLITAGLDQFEETWELIFITRVYIYRTIL